MKIPAKQEEEKKEAKVYGEKVFRTLGEYEEEEKNRRRRETRIPICTTKKEREEMGIISKEEKKERSDESVWGDSTDHSYTGSWGQLSRQKMTVVRHSIPEQDGQLVRTGRWVLMQDANRFGLNLDKGKVAQLCKGKGGKGSTRFEMITIKV